MERERDMRAKEAKTGVAHEASSRREGGTMRPDRRESLQRPRHNNINFLRTKNNNNNNNNNELPAYTGPRY